MVVLGCQGFGWKPHLWAESFTTYITVVLGILGVDAHVSENKIMAMDTDRIIWADGVILVAMIHRGMLVE